MIVKFVLRLEIQQTGKVSLKHVKYALNEETKEYFAMVYIRGKKWSDEYGRYGE